ncbi:hypothetical protein FACS1894172_16070 [Spirochaetia bacterium]|nr:hypothetical protein FACS1894172_16070 [Spirochaetia bacterium]
MDISTYGLENCDVTAPGFSGLAKYAGASDLWDVFPDKTLRMDQQTITLRESDGAYELAQALQLLLSYVDTGGSIKNLLDQKIVSAPSNGGVSGVLYCIPE